MYDLPLPGTIVAGKYRVETLLGEGGMSTVFRAHHELMDKAVALKWLRPELSARPEAKDRFLREARASARLKHPNVVEVYDVGVHEGALFLVMELLEGESFAELIEHGEISIPNAIRLLIGAMEGVAMAHESGIIHRDIKPENIFVVRNRVYPDGIAKILDFGISKLTDDTGSGSLTKTGHTVGTPEYMSMEQMTGQADVDARADVYSFGVLLYRALTGQSPFTGETFAAIAVEVATATPVPPRALRPDLPASLEYVVMKAMARNRDDRYPTIRDLIDALSFLGSTQGFLSQMPPGTTGGAPLLTPTPQGLRDLLPISAFRADTVELAPPPTKALTEPSISARPKAPPKRHTASLLIALLLTSGAALAAWHFWPSGEQPTAGAEAVDGADDSIAGHAAAPPDTTTAGATPRDQDRPLAQPPQENADEWDSRPVAPVRVEVVEPPSDQDTLGTGSTTVEGANTTGSGSSVLDALQKAASPPQTPPSRHERPVRHSRHASQARPVAQKPSEASPAPPAAEAVTPPAEPTAAPAPKSATGRRSGTLRSDDF